MAPGGWLHEQVLSHWLLLVSDYEQWKNNPYTQHLCQKQKNNDTAYGKYKVQKSLYKITVNREVKFVIRPIK